MVVVSPLTSLIANQRLELEKLGMTVGVIGERSAMTESEVDGKIKSINNRTTQ